MANHITLPSNTIPQSTFAVQKVAMTALQPLSKRSHQLHENIKYKLDAEFWKGIAITAAILTVIVLAIAIVTSICKRRAGKDDGIRDVELADIHPAPEVQGSPITTRSNARSWPSTSSTNTSSGTWSPWKSPYGSSLNTTPESALLRQSIGRRNYERTPESDKISGQNFNGYRQNGAEIYNASPVPSSSTLLSSMNSTPGVFNAGPSLGSRKVVVGGRYDTQKSRRDLTAERGQRRDSRDWRSRIEEASGGRNLLDTSQQADLQKWLNSAECEPRRF